MTCFLNQTSDSYDLVFGAGMICLLPTVFSAIQAFFNYSENVSLKKYIF
jgi:hypothetical protein